MKPKLPRMMLWTDKTSMEEFLCEPINKRLYGFYLELRGERWHFGPDNSAVLLFNEIYYQLTKVEYEHDLDLNLDDYTQEIEANTTGKEHGIIFVYIMFFAFLLLRENNSNVARHFQNIVFLRYNSTWNERTNRALGSIIKEDKKYSVDLRPTPYRVEELEVEELQWDEITNNFNLSSIKEVLNLWSSKEEKIIVLHLIEDAYKRISRMPVKVENIMNFIRVSGNFFSDLYSELGVKAGAAMNAERKMVHPKQINVEPNSVEEGRAEDELPSIAEMAAACEKTKEESLWWGNASWSVTYRIYCILGYKGSRESFIEEVKEWPFKKPFGFICNRHALSRPIRNGKINGQLKKWAADGASTRQVKLGERLMEILKRKENAA